MIDWDLAVSIGTRLAGSGPEVSRSEADAVVAELRAGRRPLDRPGARLHRVWSPTPGRAAPRRSWSWTGPAGSAPTPTSFDVLLSPVVDKLTEKKGPRRGVGKAVGSRVTGAEVGAVLGFLGGKVLGQFDPFTGSAGRLLLVAPNIVHVEREIGADPQRLPALGLPARGDPPGAVHRRPVDARAPVRARSAGWRTPSSPPGCWTTASRDCPRRSAAAVAATCSRSSARPSSARSWTASPG